MGDSDDTDDVDRFRLVLLAPSVFRLEEEMGATRLPLASASGLTEVVVDDFLLLPPPPPLVNDIWLESGDRESASKAADLAALSSRLLRNGRVKFISADV